MQNDAATDTSSQSSSISTAKRRAVADALHDFELPALEPPVLPPVERIKEYYLDWLLYADEIQRIAEAGRVYFYEVLLPRRERIAAGLPEQECDYDVERRAACADEWLPSKETDDWEPPILCAACDSDDTEWLRLRGTTITACKRCVKQLRQDGTPIVITAQDARAAAATKKKPAKQFPPSKK